MILNGKIVQRCLSNASPLCDQRRLFSNERGGFIERGKAGRNQTVCLISCHELNSSDKRYFLKAGDHNDAAVLDTGPFLDAKMVRCWSWSA